MGVDRLDHVFTFFLRRLIRSTCLVGHDGVTIISTIVNLLRTDGLALRLIRFLALCTLGLFTRWSLVCGSCYDIVYVNVAPKPP